MSEMTAFEKFALDHSLHVHCSGCGGCMLEPFIKLLSINPVWCVGCYKRIEAKMPVGAPRPWDGGVVWAKEGA